MHRIGTEMTDGPGRGASGDEARAFVCTQSAGRSRMAQAFFERYAPADLCAGSAGSEPAERIHPVVVEAMREVGIDIADRRPKRLTVLPTLIEEFEGERELETAA